MPKDPEPSDSYREGSSDASKGTYNPPDSSWAGIIGSQIYGESSSRQDYDRGHSDQSGSNKK